MVPLYLPSTCFSIPCSPTGYFTPSESSQIPIPITSFPTLRGPLTFCILVKQPSGASSQTTAISPQSHLPPFLPPTPLLFPLSSRRFPGSGAWDRNFGTCDTLRVPVSVKGSGTHDKAEQGAEQACGLHWSPAGSSGARLHYGFGPTLCQSVIWELPLGGHTHDLQWGSSFLSKENSLKKMASSELLVPSTHSSWDVGYLHARGTNCTVTTSCARWLSPVGFCIEFS